MKGPLGGILSSLEALVVRAIYRYDTKFLEMQNALIALSLGCVGLLTHSTSLPLQRGVLHVHWGILLSVVLVLVGILKSYCVLHETKMRPWVSLAAGATWTWISVILIMAGISSAAITTPLAVMSFMMFIRHKIQARGMPEWTFQ